MLTRFFNILLPHRCLRCECILPDEGGLCSSCWSGIQFISAPYCSQCGLPLEVDLGPNAHCGVCTKGEQAFSHARSLFVYNQASKDMILKFKHGDAQHGAPLYAQWMAKAADDLLKSSDILAPVPLHWTRLFQRTYNQSQLLAKELSHLAPQLTYAPGLLKRIRATKSQGLLSRQQRQLNLQGSIRLDESQKTLIKGKRIVLVDDVITSGATLNVCAKALLKKGAASVDAITLGRVTRS